MSTSFEKFKENASFYLISKVSSKGPDKIGNSQAITNSKELSGSGFRLVRDHDIFHHFLDNGRFYQEYRQATGNDLEREVSTSYHGEALVEVHNRFFGNLSQIPVRVNGRIYATLPLQQPGVKLKQKERIFPINPNYFGVPELKLTLNYEEQILNYQTYIIIASLISGSIFPTYLKRLQNKKENLSILNKEYFLGAEFKDIVKKYLVKNKPHRLLQELDEELITNWESSLQKTKEYSRTCLEIFKQTVLDQTTFFTDSDSIYFELLSESNITFFDELYFTNRSVNMVYKKGIESINLVENIPEYKKTEVRKKLKNLENLEKLLNKYDSVEFKQYFKKQWLNFLEDNEQFILKQFGFCNLEKSTIHKTKNGYINLQLPE